MMCFDHAQFFGFDARQTGDALTHRPPVLVLDAHGRLCGALNSNDLMRAKVI